MTGPDHYREAERLLVHTASSVRDRFGQGNTTDGVECARQQLAEAQVHATLALAAATALNDDDIGTPPRDWEEWLAAASSRQDPKENGHA